MIQSGEAMLALRFFVQVTCYGLPGSRMITGLHSLEGSDLPEAFGLAVGWFDTWLAGWLFGWWLGGWLVGWLVVLRKQLGRRCPQLELFS